MRAPDQRQRMLTVFVMLTAVAAAWMILEWGGRWMTRQQDEAFLVSPHLNWNRWHQFDPDLMWTVRPNVVAGDQTYVFNGKTVTWTINTNQDGLRQPPLHAKSKKFRIVCLGDSRTFGLGVQDEETWPEQLQQLLEQRHPDGFEVINAGVTGYTSRQGLRYLELNSEKLQPDMVIAAFAFNEAAEIPPPGMGDWEWENFHAMSGIHALLKKAVYGAGLERPSPASRHATRLSPGQTLDTFIALSRYCHERRIAPVFLFWPVLPEIVDERFLQPNISGLAIEAARLGDASLIDVSPVLRAHCESIFWDVVHLNASGYRLVAEKVADDLDSFFSTEGFIGNAALLRTAQPQFHAGGLSEERIARLTQWIRSEPGCFMPYRCLDELFNAMGSVERAIGEWRQLTETCPGAYRPWMYLGYALEWQGRDDEALAAYRRTVELETNDLWVVKTVGLFMARKSPVESIPLLERALVLDPAVKEIRPVLVRLYLEKGDLVSARKAAAGCDQTQESLPADLRRLLAPS